MATINRQRLEMAIAVAERRQRVSVSGSLGQLDTEVVVLTWERAQALIEAGKLLLQAAELLEPWSTGLYGEED